MLKNEIVAAAAQHPAIKGMFSIEGIEDRVSRYLAGIDFVAPATPEDEVQHLIENTSYFDFEITDINNLMSLISSELEAWADSNAA